jgi:hypothetical protein
MWQDVRDCADNFTRRNSGITAVKIREGQWNARREFDWSLLPPGWESDARALTNGQARAQEVRDDLRELANIVLKGGKWKGYSFKAHTEMNDVHVAIVTHSKFLHYLAQTNPLPAGGKQL